MRVPPLELINTLRLFPISHLASSAQVPQVSSSSQLVAYLPGTYRSITPSACYFEPSSITYSPHTRGCATMPRTTMPPESEPIALVKYAGSPNTKPDQNRPPAPEAEINPSAEEAPDPMARRDTFLGCFRRESRATEEKGPSDVELPHVDPVHPTGLKLFLIIFALCLAVFLIALDNAIIATAIPKITDQFHSLDDVGWYGSAYLLTTASLQLLFGKLYTFMKIKWVFLSAIGLFELGSLVCGIAPNSKTLIIGRAIAGLGSAGILSGALLILAYCVPLTKRPTYTGIVGSMYGIASVAGPLLGGVFTDKVTWRWCFFINLPIGTVTILVIIFFFQHPPQARAQAQNLWQRIRQFDPLGLVLFVPAIVCLLLACQWAGTKYPWKSVRIILLFIVFGLLTIAFFILQHLQKANATLPLRILSNRTVWASCIFSFGLGASFFVAIYYVPMWFQAIKRDSAMEAGIRNLPMLLSLVITSVIAGLSITATGYYWPFMIFSTIFMSIGAGLLSMFRPSTDEALWIGFQVVFGAGVGLGMQQPFMAVQTVLDISDVPTGTATMTFMQALGGAIFVSVGQTVFTNKLVDSLASKFPSINPSAILTGGATDFISSLPPAVRAAVLLDYNDAITSTFKVAASLAAFTVLGSALVEWKNMKKGQNAEVGPTLV
ncbi:putative efflux pump [Xylariaceae sp. FL0804]|nr:putative efflux pump [Xylariaceae sp. FL0804]